MPRDQAHLPPIARDEEHMQMALALAPSLLDEVPIGALIVHDDGRILAQSTNTKEKTNLATRHAEINAIEAAASRLGSWRLLHCTLYVTLEPCLMCAGALILSRIPRVVFGAFDPKGGAFGSLYAVHEDTRLNHQINVTSGLCAAESAVLLRNFFKKKRSAS